MLVSRTFGAAALVVLFVASCGGSGADDAAAEIDGSVAAVATAQPGLTSVERETISPSVQSEDEASTTGLTTVIEDVSTTQPEPTTPSSDSSEVAPAPSVTEPPTTSTESVAPAATPGTPETVRIRFESQVSDVPVETLIAESLAILNDPRGWVQAGFTFVADENGPYRVVLAEGPEVDALCLPLRTYSKVSCQNGPVVGLNADRWRNAVDHWVLGVEVYRGYLVNHEVGHLIGQRHPKPRCPVAGRPAGVMEQQTAGLEGCIGNPWPRDWEIAYAQSRPVVYAPLPDWGPDPVPSNTES